MAALLESHTGLQLQIEASNERNVDQSGADHGSGGVFPIRDNVDVGERLGHWDARLSLAYVFSNGKVQKAVDAVEKQRVDEEDVVEGEELVEEDEEGDGGHDELAESLRLGCLLHLQRLRQETD